MSKPLIKIVEEAGLLGSPARRTLTTAEAAERLGMKPRSVARLIKFGGLAATKRGRDWLIEEEEVERYKRERRPVGRPKNKNDDSSFEPIQEH